MNEDDRALLNFWEAERPDNKLQIPISKLQRSTKLQAQKPTCAPFAPASVTGVWCFEIWNFSGAWGLVLGVSLAGGSKNEMRSLGGPLAPIVEFESQTVGLPGEPIWPTPPVNPSPVLPGRFRPTQDN